VGAYATGPVANRAQSNAETLARTSTELRELVAAFKL
jgi:hypothetical protein